MINTKSKYNYSMLAFLGSDGNQSDWSMTVFMKYVRERKLRAFLHEVLRPRNRILNMAQMEKLAKRRIFYIIKTFSAQTATF